MSFSRRRAPDGDQFDARRGGGGVVSVLAPLLGGAGATWIAAAISEDDRAAAACGQVDKAVTDFELVLVDLDPEVHRLHYDVISNSLLWFLHHGLFDLVRRPHLDPDFRKAWDAYVSVNRSFADAALTAGQTNTSRPILVQDYHLALVPGMLRAVRPETPVAHFSHTPFCGPGSMRVLPTDVASAICHSMAQVSCGFHSERWASAYQASSQFVLGNNDVDGGGAPPTFVSSFGPDLAALKEVATSDPARRAADSLEALVGDRAMVLRVDRIEPSKNIVRGFEAYGLFLDSHPEWHGRVVFVALCYPSREALAEYVRYRHEVEAAVGAVNERWGTSDWQPVVLDTRDDFPRSVAALGMYDVLFVNPIRDGLNLVAKEGPLLNRRDGVVCLSRDAGVFDELADAVIEVQPFDLLQSAEAIAVALGIGAGERKDRALRSRGLAAARTPAGWLADLVSEALPAVQSLPT